MNSPRSKESIAASFRSVTQIGVARRRAVLTGREVSKQARGHQRVIGRSVRDEVCRKVPGQSERIDE
jgi:hypothetical protein